MTDPLSRTRSCKYKKKDVNKRYPTVKYSLQTSVFFFFIFYNTVLLYAETGTWVRIRDFKQKHLFRKL
jgi:hypothetical protein